MEQVAHNSRVASLFCGITLCAMKPVASHYPRKVQTLGDHIRKHRLDLGLRQKDVANQLGVNVNTVTNWEKNYNSPRLHMVPRVIEFLGYVPFLDAAEGTSIGEQIVRARRALGVSQTQLARRLGVDPTTLARWERGRSEPWPSCRNRIDAFLGQLEAGDTLE